jgi:hypothetical protein
MKGTLIILSVCLVAVLVALGIAYSHRGYRGIVSEVKGVRAGVLIDLDGNYPNQKMTIFVPRSVPWSNSHHGWPAVGTRITAIGPVTQYRGRPEIIVNDPAQLDW